VKDVDGNDDLDREYDNSDLGNGVGMRMSNDRGSGLDTDMIVVDSRADWEQAADNCRKEGAQSAEEH
jgi:hypothetical protein